MGAPVSRPAGSRTLRFPWQACRCRCRLRHCGRCQRRRSALVDRCQCGCGVPDLRRRDILLVLPGLHDRRNYARHCGRWRCSSATGAGAAYPTGAGGSTLNDRCQYSGPCSRNVVHDPCWCCATQMQRSLRVPAQCTCQQEERKHCGAWRDVLHDRTASNTRHRRRRRKVLIHRRSSNAECTRRDVLRAQEQRKPPPA